MFGTSGPFHDFHHVTVQVVLALKEIDTTLGLRKKVGGVHVSKYITKSKIARCK